MALLQGETTMIGMQVRPRETLTWEEFCSTAPPFSIALDGFVSGPFMFDPKGPFLNLNHHEGCNRTSTRSTCGQVMMVIKQELYLTFRKNGEPTAILCVNDPDNDVCMSVWLLKNYERIEGMRSEPLITRLVAVVDFLDATAGLYPLDVNSRIRREIAWIFEPYTKIRQTGRLPGMSADEMAALIDSVCGRITDYTLGNGQKISLDTDYKVLYTGTGWAMIKELGFEARAQFIGNGINAFISVRVLDNGQTHCSIGKISQFVPFPIEKLYDALNRAEGRSPKKIQDRWGGGDTIGGSPRNGGTKLKLEEIQNIVESVVVAQKD